MKQKRKLKDSILRKTKREYPKNEKYVFKIPPDAEILVCDCCKEYRVYPTHYDIKMMIILYKGQCKRYKLRSMCCFNHYHTTDNIYIYCSVCNCCCKIRNNALSMSNLKPNIFT